MANNMYRVGDCVYFETSSAAPYQIRRIEELCKTPTGNVEAKVMSFYRRRDLSQNLISLADKHQNGGSDEENGGGVEVTKEELSERQKHQLKHRELFLSRQIETLPATHIRGKCLITLLNETELFNNYLVKDDSFFYSLVYDPQQKTLLADKGEIRVGPRFQAETPQLLTKGESDNRDLKDLEELVWSPNHSLSFKQIDNFLMLARSVGTFARSLDCSSTVKQPSLHMSAAAASRDITLFQAMHLLHRTNYTETEAMNLLVPTTGPLLCRDELEEWSSAEACIFEEALDKNGKDFFEIRNDALSWKTHKALVEYYYMWKTTDRYVQQKRIKAAEAESKLKQVYIPTYNKPNPAQIVDKSDGRPCESCYTVSSTQWYSWGPAVMQGRTCCTCWGYWKKYGGLKMATRVDNNSIPGSNGYSNNNNANNNNNNNSNNNNNNNNIVASVNNEKSLVTPSKVFKCSAPGCGKTDFRTKAHLLQHLTSCHGLPPMQACTSADSNSPCPVMKTRAAFCLVTTPLTRASRQVCKPTLDIRRACRHPFQPINISNVKLECQQRLSDTTPLLRALKPRDRLNMLTVSSRLGIPLNAHKPPILNRTSGSKKVMVNSRKRPPQEELNGPPLKLHVTTSPNTTTTATPTTIAATTATTTTVAASTTPPPNSSTCGEDDDKVVRKTSVTVQVGSGADAHSIKLTLPKVRGQKKLKGGGVILMKKSPAEVFHEIFFIITEPCKQSRKQLTTVELKKAGRKPWKSIKISSKTCGVINGEIEKKKDASGEGVVVLD